MNLGEPARQLFKCRVTFFRRLRNGDFNLPTNGCEFSPAIVVEHFAFAEAKERLSSRQGCRGKHHEDDDPLAWAGRSSRHFHKYGSANDGRQDH